MRHALLSLLFVVGLALPGNAQDLLHYWNFNTGAGPDGMSWPSPVAPDFTVGGASLEHNLADGTLQNFGGTDLNAEFGDSWGGSLSIQAGADNVNNGRHVDLVIPTTGYSGIRIDYATRGTSTGFKTHDVSYSIDGAEFTPLTTLTANTTATWSVSTIDLAAVGVAADNADLTVRITFDGGTTVSGNNRLDNITVRGFAEGDNRPPFFTSVLEDAQIDAGQAFTFQFEAEDPDGDELTFALENPPTGAAIDAATGLFSWTPAVDQGDRDWTIVTTVTDGQAIERTEARLHVVAFPGNTAPFFVTTLPDTLVRVGDHLTYTFVAGDADGDPVELDVLSLPEGATFDGSTGAFSWTVTSPGAYRIVVSATDGMAMVAHDAVVGVRGLIFPGTEGAELRALLRQHYAPQQVLSYDAARDSMYAVLDLEADGYVRGVYTGYAVKYEGEGTPRSIMSAGGIDAEHTWPQSRGAGAGMPRSDLHHLFPTRSTVNNARGNLPFAEIAPQNVIRWYRDAISVATPPADPGTYSRLGTQTFQPRDVHLGATGRAMTYFFAIHEDVADAFYFATQAETLARWAEEQVPAPAEVRRTLRVASWQGNVNPFVFDSTLAARIIVDVEQPEVMPIGEARLLEDGAAVIVEGIVTRARGRYMRFQDETGALSTFQSFGALFNAIERGEVAQGDSIRIVGPMATFNELRQISSITQFEVRSRGHDLPEPVKVTLDEIAANGVAYESMLIQVDGFRFGATGTFAESTTYGLLDGQGNDVEVDFRVQRASDSELVGAAIPDGRLTFVGVLGRFQETFQLEGVRLTDLAPYVDTFVPELPAYAFSVSTAYPNPTADRATIHLEAGRTQQVRAELLDGLGRRVAVVFDGVLVGGSSTPIVLDAGGLSSGVYFVRIAGEEGVSQQSLVVVR